MKTSALGTRVYVGSEDGITALNATTGAVLWHYGLGLVQNIRGIVGERVVGAGAVADIRIYAATESGWVFCFKDNGSHAQPVWTSPAGDPRFYSCSSLTLAGSKLLFLASDVDPCSNANGNIGLVCLSRADGHLLYFTPTRFVSSQDPSDDFEPVAAPSVNETEGRVYFENRALSLGSGSILWTAQIGTPLALQHTVVDVQNDRVLMAGRMSSDLLFSIDGSSGLPVWIRSQVPDAAPVVANGMVFLGDVGGVLRAVDGATGAQVWAQAGLASVERLLASNADATNPARIWACDFNGPGFVTSRIACFRQVDGALLGSMTGGDSANWRPALGPDGIYNTACCGGVVSNASIVKFQ